MGPIAVEDQMVDTVESTELGVRYNSGTVTAIGNLVKTSSELVLGVQHSDKLQDIFEKCPDGCVEHCYPVGHVYRVISRSLLPGLDFRAWDESMRHETALPLEFIPNSI